MAKSFKILEQRMPASARARAEAKARKLMAEMPSKGENRGWPEADHLRELAAEVVALKERAVETQPWLPLDAYLRACSVKGKNAPGEPRLAMLLQQELKISS